MTIPYQRSATFLGTAVLAVVLAIPPAVQANSVMSSSQPIFVDSNGYWQMLGYNYTTQEAGTSIVKSGSGYVELMQVPINQFYGNFLYDYERGAFVEAYTMFYERYR